MEDIKLSNIRVIRDTVPNKIFNILTKRSELAKNNQSPVYEALAGNIEESYLMNLNEDQMIVEDYLREICQDSRVSLVDIWVNYQKKYEFNPIHFHSGTYSFVIWVKIPYDFDSESRSKMCRTSNSKCPGAFTFYYTDGLGQIENFMFRLNPSFEKQIIVFPSMLRHQVYPFYSSDEYRISIAGNLQ